MMHPEIELKIREDFLPQDHAEVMAALNALGLNHVMANSQTNLDNTLLAILQLAKGNIAEVYNLVEAAKKDFRDIIYWATMESDK